MVDNILAYHGALERPSLKELWVVIFIHHMFMKMSKNHGITIAKGDQMEARECYLNSLRKVTR